MKRTEFKVKFDKKKCLGCGLCATMAPDLFVFNTNGTVSVKKDLNNSKIVDKKIIQKIARNCIGRALKIN